MGNYLPSMWGKVRRIRLAALRLRHDAQAVVGYLPTDTDNAEIEERKRFIRAAFEALRVNGIAGDYVEFGSASAVTFRLAFAANRLARTHRHLWSFDSFAGLPEQGERDDHPLWVPGTMAMTLHDFREACRQAGMTEGDYTTVEGFYSETLRDDADGIRPDKIAFAYVDCDLYTSTTAVLRFLRERLCQGMIVAFDDFYCFGPSEASGERLALANLTNEMTDWRFVPYMQFGWHGMSFMLERAELVDNPSPW